MLDSYATLARVIVAALDGLILQHVVNPDMRRSTEDLDIVIDMLVGLAVAPADPR